ncbi:acyltransferase family protein [Singulisphaera rosea]
MLDLHTRLRRESPATRLPFLDGMRGLAALYVVLHHAALMVPPSGLSGPSVAARFLLRHGHYAVAVFIVLSGYCLMRPIADDPSAGLQGGFLKYLGRRARRIIPPYLAALLLCWVAIAMIPALGRAAQGRWTRALPANDTGVVVSHLLLVHNLDERWIFRVDPPMWSVATEWQIYLLFPLLLGIRRRGGILAAVGAGFAIGFGVAVLSGPLRNPALRQLCPWYLGLFALGMAAAVASTRPRLVVVEPRTNGPMLGPGLVLAAVILAGAAFAGQNDRDIMIADPLVGALSAALLVRLSRLSMLMTAGPKRPVLRLLESRKVVALGSISYSLYLTHFPVLALTDAFLIRAGMGTDARLWALILAVTPLCVLAATGFSQVFERPFLRGEPVSSPIRRILSTRGHTSISIGRSPGA